MGCHFNPYVPFKSASSNYSRQLNWFSTSTQNTLCAILCWVNEQNEQVQSERFFVFYFFLKTDLISFFIYDLFYKFWFSIPAKCVKPCIQLSQISVMSNTRSGAQYITLKLVSLESVPLNWVKRCYFWLYYQMLFLEVILLSTMSKMSNYMVKTSNFCLGSHLIGFSTLELC